MKINTVKCFLRITTYNIFKRACENGYLRNVERFFDKFNDEFEILEMRNLVVINGNLNILKYFYQRGVDMNGVYNNDNPLRIDARKGWVDSINDRISIRKNWCCRYIFTDVLNSNRTM